METALQEGQIFLQSLKDNWQQAFSKGSYIQVGATDESKQAITELLERQKSIEYIWNTKNKIESWHNVYSQQIEDLIIKAQGRDFILQPSLAYIIINDLDNKVIGNLSENIHCQKVNQSAMGIRPWNRAIAFAMAYNELEQKDITAMQTYMSMNMVKFMYNRVMSELFVQGVMNPSELPRDDIVPYCFECMKEAIDTGEAQYINR